MYSKYFVLLNIIETSTSIQDIHMMQVGFLFLGMQVE